MEFHRHANTTTSSKTTGLHPVISSPAAELTKGWGERNYRPAQASAGRRPGLPTHAKPLGDNFEADGGVRGGIAEAAVAAGRPLPVLRSTRRCAAFRACPAGRSFGLH